MKFNLKAGGRRLSLTIGHQSGKVSVNITEQVARGRETFKVSVLPHVAEEIGEEFRQQADLARQLSQASTVAHEG